MIIKLQVIATIPIGATKNTPGLQQTLAIFGNLEDAKMIARMYLKLRIIFSGMPSALKEVLRKNLEGTDLVKNNSIGYLITCAMKLLMHVKLFWNKKKNGLQSAIGIARSPALLFFFFICSIHRFCASGFCFPHQAQISP